MFFNISVGYFISWCWFSLKYFSFVLYDKSRTTYRSKSPRYPSNEIAYHNATKITKKKYPVIMQQNHDEAQSWELSMISITNF